MTTPDPATYHWPTGTVVEPDGTIVFRPSWETYRSKFLQVPGFLVAIVAFNAFRMNDVGLSLAIAGVTLAVGALGTWAYFQRAFTSVGPRGLVRKDLFRNTTVPSDRIGLVIFARELRHFDTRVDTTLIVTDTEARKVAMFNGPFWSREQLYAMASAMQRPTWQPSGPVSYGDIKDRYPKAVPLMYSNPWLFAFGVVGAVIAAVVVIAIVVAAATS
ncbi:hypothetical protein [Actinomarinicola tropica]|uniref:PH domain-containing protein n=1 Tax=Actinomarinicola tropica TaxID=2789776 RepID=A0A5Q2RMJ4_9ACTN|nr:hypothetical protein [Actinomarinicola tropica]QGG94405.1 hypothetical protein GH723_04405 [Actinomarinicola tropica]